MCRAGTCPAHYSGAGRQGIRRLLAPIFTKASLPKGAVHYLQEIVTEPRTSKQEESSFRPLSIHEPVPDTYVGKAVLHIRASNVVRMTYEGLRYRNTEHLRVGRLSHLLRLPCAAVFLSALAACRTPVDLDQPNKYPFPRSGRPQDEIVRLYAAPLPFPLGALALHLWFLAFDPKSGECSRWEVWQEAWIAPGSWGHVYRNLLPPTEGIGGGRPFVLHEWRGQTARRIMDILFRPGSYPARANYRSWPGPNCNSYAAWVLRQAAVSIDIDPRAIGKDWPGCFRAGLSPTLTGIQAETPLLGLQVGLKEGFELHLFALTFGVDLWTPALKTPMGRIGFPEPLSD